MRVRGLDTQHDWLFGNGVGDYAVDQAAIATDINMNLLLFLGECFFATNQGIDWFGLNGGSSQLAVTLAVNSAILNTPGVTGILQTSATLSPVTRRLTVQYRVQTVFSQLQSSFIYDFGTIGG